MRVSGLDNMGDWRFGKGRAVYVRDSQAIRQNVVTRLRSFTDDWFLNVGHGLPWFRLLGSRANEKRVLRAIERQVLQTEGVLSIDRLRIVRRDRNRGIVLELRYVDVFDQSIADTLELPE